MMHFLRRALFLTALLASAVLARAGVSYDESPVFSFDTRDYLAGLAAESATFAFDTRLVDGLQGAAVSGVFAFDTSFGSAPPLFLTGTVRDSASVPLVGAAVKLKRYETVFWQGVTVAGGTFSAPNLSPWNYMVIVTRPGYVTRISNHSGATGGSQTLNIALQSLPAPPTAVTTNQTPPASAIYQCRPWSQTLPDAPKLRLLGSNGIFTSSLASLDPGRPTVVITHGWIVSGNSAPVWPEELGLAVKSAPGATTANILLWDWHTDATAVLLPIDRAACQGEQLGRALLQSLGAGYSQHVHFIGHSLGTIANRYACDYIHGTMDRSGNNPVSHWDKNATLPHVTLMDEAEIATVFGSAVSTSAEIAWQIANQRGGVIGVSAGLVAGVAATVATWKSPVPKSAKWVDSYISAFGLQRQDAVNVCLLKPAAFYSRINPLATLDAAHAYSHEWYLDSVTATGIAPAISWKLSLEAGAAFPPTGSGRNAGALWLENLATFDPLDQFQVPTPTNNDCNLLILSAFLAPPHARAAAQDALAATQILDATGRIVMASYETGLQLVGEAGGTVIYKSEQVLTDTKEKIGQLWDAALDRAANVLDSVGPDSQLVGPLSAAVPSMQLITQPAPAPLLRAQNLAGAGATNQPGYAWMTVNVPANAGLMAFDFTVTGEPADDCVACAVNGQNVFALPARFAPDGSPVSTDMIDILAYAGQSVELFFGLVGGTSTTGAVTVDGIRFITIPQPKIGLTLSGSNVAVKWPAAAVGWVLESTDSLTLPDWQTVPVNTGVFVESGVATLVQPVSEAARFFRLRRNP